MLELIGEKLGFSLNYFEFEANLISSCKNLNQKNVFGKLKYNNTLLFD